MAALPDRIDETAPRATEAAAVDLASVLSLDGSSLRRVAATYARSADQRADLSQEIALALCRALPQFRGESSVRTFALRVAHNAALAAATQQRAHDARVDPAGPR